MQDQTYAVLYEEFNNQFSNLCLSQDAKIHKYIQKKRDWSLFHKTIIAIDWFWGIHCSCFENDAFFLTNRLEAQQFSVFFFSLQWVRDASQTEMTKRKRNYWSRNVKRVTPPWNQVNSPALRYPWPRFVPAPRASCPAGRCCLCASACLLSCKKTNIKIKNRRLLGMKRFKCCNSIWLKIFLLWFV